MSPGTQDSGPNSQKIFRKAIFVVGCIAALSMLEVNIGPLLAAIGAAGFIMGYKLQGMLSNFAAGIMILIITGIYNLSGERAV